MDCEDRMRAGEEKREAPPVALFDSYADRLVELFSRGHTVAEVRFMLYSLWRDAKASERKES